MTETARLEARLFHMLFIPQPLPHKASRGCAGPHQPQAASAAPIRLPTSQHTCTSKVRHGLKTPGCFTCQHYNLRMYSWQLSGQGHSAPEATGQFTSNKAYN